MAVSAIAPTIITADIQTTVDFYTKHLGLGVATQNGWYVNMTGGGGQIAFMLPYSPFVHECLENAFDGKGLVVGVVVDDVDAALASFQGAGVAIACDMRTEASGERHFFVRDPNGVVLNVTNW